MLCFLFVEVGDYKEGYYIGVEVPENDPKAEKPFYGSNVWPEPGKRLSQEQLSLAHERRELFCWVSIS